MATPYELWKQAGGETDAFDRGRYRELLLEHGHLRPLEPGEVPQPLPCGWPGAPNYLDRAHMTADERQAELRGHAAVPPGFLDGWEEE